MSFSRYPKYKDSGVEWLGEVPESWERRKIAHAFERVGSGTTPPTGQDEWYSDGDIPWITTGELRETVITETSKYVTAKALEEFSTLRVYPAGSLAIAMYGATIGRLGILGVSATTNQACCVLSGEISLSIRFTYFWLLAFKQQIIDLYAAGGGQPNINQEVIANFRVPAPTIGDQVTITVFLDRETAKMDALVAEQEKLIAILKEKRQAVISHAVTKGLDPSVPMKDSGVEWIGEVPEHWVVRRLKHCLTLITTKATKRETPVALENIEGWSGRFINTESDFEGDGVGFSAGDILFGKLRPYLAKVYLAEFDGEAVGDFHVLRPANSMVGRFVQYQILSRDFIEIADSSTFGAKMPRVGWDFLGNMMFLASPLSEQTAIATFLDRETVKINSLTAEAERGIVLLKERRSALISAAVTGKIKVA
ncbi:restriction endonuclease subunit S [Ferrovum myxofaciens]|uniref:restriction endonuclease subunit S n=1 Tax=Ferrovum myxofaciens TaxID=416213 RepID=UPI0004E17733|nr:restriction endonuclease subunit S [Ferrovum myxofaciens]